MEAAMAEAGLTSPAQVWCVNCHATSTPLGDRAEAGAVARLLGPGARVTSNKGSIGHLLGAAGAVEAVFSVLSVHHGVIPPTINIDNVDCDIDSLGLNIVRSTQVGASLTFKI